MQYVQNLSQPYIIFTHALMLPVRTFGRFSMMSPSFDHTSMTISFDKYASCKMLGNRWMLCVPKIISTWSYVFKILLTTDSSCDIQPHTPIITSGLRCFKDLR